jgi:uncharacterized protein
MKNKILYLSSSSFSTIALPLQRQRFRLMQSKKPNSKYDPSTLLSKAQSKKRDFRLTAQKIKTMKSQQADALINGLHDKVFVQINCLECANCCRGLGPRLLRSDIERLSVYLKMKNSDFTEKYLRTDEDGDQVFKSMPCPFLMDDNHCMVYSSRPRACREYPHTDQKNIRSIMHLCIKNTETCPAVFEIFNRL